MKKVPLFTAVLLTSMLAISQRGATERFHNMGPNKMSVEQVATLKTKKMTLALDLTEQQQAEIMKINSARAEERKLSIDERKKQHQENKGPKRASEREFELRNARLDKQLAHQAEMKTVLNAEQYQQWKRMHFRRHTEGKRKMRNERRRR